MENIILCTEVNIAKILERTKDEEINVERNFIVACMRFWAKNSEIGKEELYIPDNCEKHGFVEGKYNIGQMIRFFADMLEE